MTGIDRLIDRLKRSRADAASATALAEAAIAAQAEERALPHVATAAAHRRNDPLLWQWTGLLHRALDQHADAMRAFNAAAQLAPGNARIAQGRAQVALEAGLDARSLFDAAIRLQPNDGNMLLGRAAARLAAGDSDHAMAELEALLGHYPDWYPGHQKLIQLRWMMGDQAGATEMIERSLVARPRDLTLWHILILARMDAGCWDKALDVIQRGRTSFGEHLIFTANEATARSEIGDVDAADALFAAVANAGEVSIAIHNVRHLLRTARVDSALPMIDRWLAPTGPQRGMWPYASLAWRLSGDPRSAWLDGDQRFISVIDLAAHVTDLNRLAMLLRGLHRARGQHLDQSVRGGTQTDGPLFSRVEPEIQALRSAVLTAVADHVGRLPPRDPGHPLLAAPRPERARFAGSWSVRLRDGGYHANHVHPAGWISSAFYVALPARDEQGSEAGWLTLGSPQAELGLDLAPVRTIEPRPGRLVLFPSTMWHGTNRFGSGERLTVAFDIALPPS